MTDRFYITTPIYYLNAAPHLGTAYSTIAADTLARFHRLRGHDTYFLTGTDEHGQKIEKAAVEKGMSPREYVDHMAGLFRDAWPKLGIAPDDFIRTTEPRHEQRVQELWSRVAKNGDIYLGHHEGWYCVADEAFFTEKELKDGPTPGSKLSPTGRPVEWVREENYFFRLSKYTERLLDFYERHPGFIQPESRRNEVLNFVKQGLQDLSVSRTSFTWGVPVPGDPKHVMYVWFDALANYWTALGDDHDPRQRFWPPTVHLVGKEISRFHAVFWPAFLLAAGFPEESLPGQIYAHGWLTVNGEKMSKSSGNFLEPGPIAEAVGADALRYYLMRAVAFGQDGDFSHQDLLSRFNNELGNDLGNLLNRSLGLCAKSSGGKVPAYGDEGPLEIALKESAATAAEKASAELNAVAPHRALEAIWAFCRDANAYVDRAAPWKALKAGDQARVDTILASLLEACGQISVLIAPFMPTKSAEMRTQLGLPALSPAVGVDLWPAGWVPRPAGAALAIGAPLFPRLDEPRQKEILDALVPKKPAAAPEAAKSGAPASPETPTPPTVVSGGAAPVRAPIEYADFEKVDLRVGVVLSAERVPKKDKLLDLRVDIGEPEPRRIIAGLALSLKPEDLVGRRVIVVANLAPRDFGKGLVSAGMLLAAGVPDALSLIGVDEKAAPGTRVKLGRLSSPGPPPTPAVPVPSRIHALRGPGDDRSALSCAP
jgi:methionyl-tRNA synthetase